MMLLRMSYLQCSTSVRHCAGWYIACRQDLAVALQNHEQTMNDHYSPICDAMRDRASTKSVIASTFASCRNTWQHIRHLCPIQDDQAPPRMTRNHQPPITGNMGGLGLAVYPPYVPLWAAVGDWSIARHTLQWGRGFDLKDTIMWVVGIVLAVVAAGLMVWTEIADGPLIVLGMLGILFIAVGARGRRSQQR
jgi:hypothetical protein